MMQIEATLVKDDIAGLMADFCPLKITLGHDGTIELSEPRDIEILPNVGIRANMTVDVHWPVLGVRIPVTV